MSGRTFLWWRNPKLLVSRQYFAKYPVKNDQKWLKWLEHSKNRTPKILYSFTLNICCVVILGLD